MTEHRPPGLYEELITRRLEAELGRIRDGGWRDEIAALDPAEAPQVLARFVHDLLEPLLGAYTGDTRTVRQLELVNDLVEFLRTRIPDSPVLADDALQPPCSVMLSEAAERSSRSIPSRAPEARTTRIPAG